MADQSPNPQYVKNIPQPHFRTRYIPTMLPKILRLATITEKLSFHQQETARQAFLDRLTQLDPKAPNLAEQIGFHGRDCGFIIKDTDEIVVRIRREIQNPLGKIINGEFTRKDIPDEVWPLLEAEKEIPLEPVPPLPEEPEVQELADQGNTFKKAIKILGIRAHPGARLAAEGIDEQTFATTANRLQQAFVESGLNPAEYPIVQTYLDASEQYNAFAQLNQNVTTALQVFHHPERAAGLIKPAEIATQLKIPFLGQLKVEAIEFGAQKTTFKAALTQNRKIVGQLGKAIGKTKVGQTVSAKALALAAKMGLTVTGKAVTFSVPVAGQALAAIWALDQTMQALEKIPVVGVPFKVLNRMTIPGQIRTLKKRAKQEAELVKRATQGDPEAVAGVTVRTGLTVGTLLLVRRVFVRPFLRIGRRIRRGFRGQTRRIRRYLRLGLLNYRRIARERRKKRRRRIIIGIIIGICVIILLTILIVVMLIGGSFMTEPIPIQSGGTVGLVESDYMSVQKTANPGQVRSENLPQMIRYEVTVTPKISPLTINSIVDEISINPPGVTPTLTYLSPDPEPTQIYDTVVFVYETTLTTDQDNSMITNSFTITITAPDGVQDTLTATQNVYVGDIPAGSCPVTGTFISCGSYKNFDGLCQHGNNYYWSGMTACSLTIPANFLGYGWCFGPTDSIDPDGSTNVCASQDSLCPHYGWATDIRTNSTSDPVQLPLLDGPRQWELVRSGVHADGPQYFHVYRAVNPAPYTSIELIYVHMSAPPTWCGNVTCPSGHIVGYTYDFPGNDHLHYELVLNGNYVIPDFMCGGQGPYPGTGGGGILPTPAPSQNFDLMFAHTASCTDRFDTRCDSDINLGTGLYTVDVDQDPSQTDPVNVTLNVVIGNYGTQGVDCTTFANPQVTLTFPSQFQYISGSCTSPCNVSANQATWQLPDLPCSPSSTTLHLTTTVPTSFTGTVYSSASINGQFNNQTYSDTYGPTTFRVIP